MSVKLFGCGFKDDIQDKHNIIKQTKEKWSLSAFIDFEQTRFGCLWLDVAGLYINTL